MDLGTLAGITIVDVYVVAALTALAIAMWTRNDIPHRGARVTARQTEAASR